MVDHSDFVVYLAPEQVSDVVQQSGQHDLVRGVSLGGVVGGLNGVLVLCDRSPK